eukprot:TRINITY_DN92100_c0_g1_i1.p1 TRINITY_DN92100_c0_g1~~TRINITY_DN92100_c0_g1_i1.p1  ORF type:complete len:400 (+),score=56.93 TRINITY_DN92100_c0_g1_i1:76-1275(+)
MIEEVVTAVADDFEEICRHLSTSFDGTDFKRFHPRIYRQHRATWHRLCRREDAIASCALIAPCDWLVGDSVLKVAGVGSVSTASSVRGRGYMQKLLEHCSKELQEAGVDLAVLGGQRQRYGHYGFENCGSVVELSFNGANAKHRESNLHRMTFAPMSSQTNEELIAAAALHRRRRLRVCREDEPAEFLLFLRAWGAHAYAAYDADKCFRGYFCVSDVDNGSKQEMLELEADSPEAASAIVSSWLQLHQTKDLKVLLPQSEMALVRHLSAWCEASKTCHANMFRIFNWEKVLAAFFQLRVEMAPAGLLPEGCLHIDIGTATASSRLQLRLAGGRATCCSVDSTDFEADVICDERTAMRLLFGPESWETVAGSCKHVSNNALPLLACWCPLPFTWASQDGV